MSEWTHGSRAGPLCKGSPATATGSSEGSMIHAMLGARQPPSPPVPWSIGCPQGSTIFDSFSPFTQILAPSTHFMDGENGSSEALRDLPSSTGGWALRAAAGVEYVLLPSLHWALLPSEQGTKCPVSLLCSKVMEPQRGSLWTQGGPKPMTNVLIKGDDGHTEG